MRFPIRFKLFGLIVTLVCLSIGAYLALAYRVFRDDKVTLVYELNAAHVRTTASKVKSELEKVADKIKLLTQGHQDAAWVRAVFEAEPSLVSFSLHRPSDDGSGAGGWSETVTVRNPDYLKLYGLGPEEISRVRSDSPPPFSRALAEGPQVTNSTLPGGAPLATLTVPIRIAGDSAASVAVADVRLDGLLSLLAERGIATVFVVNPQGQAIAHPEAQVVASRASLAENPIVREALGSTTALEIRRFEWNGARWLGAFADAGFGGLKVISQVRESEAFGAARRLAVKSALLALLVVTIALLVTAWFARGFTAPIDQLLAATRKLSRWDFDGSVHVKSHDEIAELATAFNSMAGDLQAQRKLLDTRAKELERQVRERTTALEEEKRSASEAQNVITQTTRLAALGELAGATAHEVLNPLNNINIRVNRARAEIQGPEAEDRKLLRTIVGAWRKAYLEKGLDGLSGELRRPGEDGKPLVEEDLANLGAISDDADRKAEARARDLDQMTAEVERITKLVGGMRSLARVGGDRFALDVHRPLDDTFSALAHLLETHGVKLVKDYGPELREQYSVKADPDELVQVFSNLLRNAIQAIAEAKRREGVIRVSTRAKGDRIEVRITDNGAGIRDSDLARLFEPRFTTKPAGTGTGLGLSISRRLTRAFHGEIEVEATAPGQGSTFLVWLPVNRTAV